MKIRTLLLALLLATQLPLAAAQPDGPSQQERRARFESLPPEQKREALERLAASGKRPMLSALWPHLSEAQKAELLDAAPADRRALLREHLQALPEAERKRLRATRQQNAAMVGDGDRSAAEPSPESLQGQPFGQ